jgi:hypothetical protein
MTAPPGGWACPHLPNPTHNAAAPWCSIPLMPSSAATHTPAGQSPIPGLQHLLSGAYVDATALFQQCAPRYATVRPSLWLRLAECCLSNATAAETGASPQHPIANIVGEPPNTVVLMARAAPQVGVAADGNTAASALPEAPDLTACGCNVDRPLTLAYAALCLRNVEHLLERSGDSEADVSVPLSAGAAPASKAGPSVDDEDAPRETDRPSGPAAEARTLRCALLTCRAYLHLMLGYPRAALTDAQLLLDGSQWPGTLGQNARLLARCYAAEALCSLGRPDEAVEHLSAGLLERDELDTSAAASAEPAAAGGEDDKQRRIALKPGASAAEGDSGAQGAGDGPDEDQKHHFVLSRARGCGGTPLSDDAARVALLVDLASVYCSQGEWSAAHGCCTTALSLQPHSLHALLALVQTELARGNVSQARLWLARGRPAPSSRPN